MERKLSRGAAVLTAMWVSMPGFATAADRFGKDLNGSVPNFFGKGRGAGAPPAPAQAIPAAEAGEAIVRMLYVTSDGADLRSQPLDGDGQDNFRMTQLMAGESLKELGRRRDGWVYVETERLRDFDSDGGAWGNAKGWVRGESLSDDASLAVARPEMATTGQRQAFVEALKQFLGTPYKWGGTSPGRDGGVDCSGLIVAALTRIGMNQIPRTAADQQRATSAKPLGDPGSLQAGDLIFAGQPAKHVVIFIGDGQVIESPNSGSFVSISNLQQRLQSLKEPSTGSLLP